MCVFLLFQIIEGRPLFCLWHCLPSRSLNTASHFIDCCTHLGSRVVYVSLITWIAWYLHLAGNYARLESTDLSARESLVRQNLVRACRSRQLSIQDSFQALTHKYSLRCICSLKWWLPLIFTFYNMVCLLSRSQQYHLWQGRTSNIYFQEEKPM